MQNRANWMMDGFNIAPVGGEPVITQPRRVSNTFDDADDALADRERYIPYRGDAEWYDEMIRPDRDPQPYIYPATVHHGEHHYGTQGLNQPQEVPEWRRESQDYRGSSVQGGPMPIFSTQPGMPRMGTQPPSQPVMVPPEWFQGLYEGPSYAAPPTMPPGMHMPPSGVAPGPRYVPPSTIPMPFPNHNRGFAPRDPSRMAPGEWRVLPKHQFERGRPWRAGLFECTEDSATCMCAFCNPFYICILSGDYHEGWSFPLWPCLGCAGALVGLRAKVRTRLNIEGSLMNDAVKSTFCGPCVMSQLSAERPEYIISFPTDDKFGPPNPTRTW